MNQALRSRQFFTDKFGLDDRALEHGLAGALGKTIDYADLYFEYTVSEAISLEDGMVKKASKSVNQGIGVRANAAEKTGYAYSDEITPDRILHAAREAKGIGAPSGNAKGRAPVAVVEGRDLYPVKERPDMRDLGERVRLLEEMDKAARAYDPRIKQVMISFAAERKSALMVNSDGEIAADFQPLSSLRVNCVAADGTNRQTGSSGGGGRVEYGHYLDGNLWKRFAEEAARQAIVNLDAVDCPAGVMDVVLGPGWPGILLHEAVGHGLEADFNRKGTSAFAGRIGEKVASPLCTVVDDGTIAWRRGSLNVDDEGIPTQRTTLIENGVLKGYITDRLNARLMGIAPTGNGRRESYAHMPMPRMTNTFMLAGEDDPDEIVKNVAHGLYAVAFGGGQVDITNGKFVFSASEAYLIENGKITRPVKGATLIGSGPDALKRVSRVGGNLELDMGIGTCGKDGQSVPVGVGLPTIRIDEMTVGGTQGGE